MSKIAEKKNTGNKKNKVPKLALVSNSVLERMRLILLALIAIVVFYPPFLRGLYFETEQVPTEIYILSVYIFFLIYKFLKQDKKFIRTPIEYVSVGFLVVYFISILFAVGTREAIVEWLKYCMFFAVFIMLSELLTTYKSRLFILWTIVASALGISIIGIDGIAGSRLVNVLNSAFKSIRAQNDMFFGVFVGNRVNSTFQYPNATAAYLMTIFFITISLMMISKKVYSKILAGLSSYVVLITFMLTLSRGAMIFLPLAGLLFIVMQPNGNKLKSIFNIIPSGMGMLLTVSKLSNIMASPEGNETNVWKFFILGMIITVIAQIILELIEFILLRTKDNNENVFNKIKILGYILCGLACIAVVAGSVVVATTKAPLILSHEMGQADSIKSVRRSFNLEPEKEYKLVYNVQAENKNKKPSAYSIYVASRDFSGIINEKDTAVISSDEKATNGTEQRELKFKTPSNTRTVSITFVNNFEGTNVEFKDAKIVAVGASDKEKTITLKYKYVPESIYARIDEAKETRSGIERTIFARDGFKIFKDHPILGGGGGSWPIQYFAHQSYLYWSTQAHNYPVQVAVETGILGIIVLLGLWVAVALQVIGIIKKRKEQTGDTGILNAGVLAACLALIMHSCMDFDLSLSAIYLVLWELLAILNSDMLLSSTTTEEKDRNIVNNLIYKIKPVSINPVITLVCTIAVIVLPIMIIGGLNNNAKVEEMMKQNNVSGAKIYLSKAISWDLFSAKYKGNYINMVLNQGPSKITKGDIATLGEYAKSIENAGEHNSDIAANLASFYLNTGNIDKGMYYLNKMAQLKPFVPDCWEQKILTQYQMAEAYKKSGDNKSSEKYYNDLFNTVEEIKKASESSMIPFTVTSPSMELIEKASLIQDKKNSTNEVIASKSVFYALNTFDIDKNGIPDEWNDTNTNDLKIQVDGNKLTAETAAGKQGILQSRKIQLQPNKNYLVSIELENYSDVNEIQATLSGQKDPVKLVKNGTSFMAEINTPATAQIDPLSMGIVVNGKYLIKSAMVIEK